MRDNNLTQMEFGQLVGTSGSTISMFLSSKTNPNSSTYEKLADFLRNSGYFTRLGLPTEKLTGFLQTEEEILKNDIGFINSDSSSDDDGKPEREPEREEFSRALNSQDKAHAITAIMTYDGIDEAKKHHIVTSLFPQLKS